MRYSNSFSAWLSKAIQCVLFVTFTLLSNGVFCQDINIVEEEYTEEVNEGILHYFDFTLNPSFPINTFKDKYSGTPFGFSIAYSKQSKLGSMNYLGAQFSYANIGSISSEFNQFDIRTGTNWMNLQFMYRHFPDFYFWKIEPFFEASFGPQWMYTLTTTMFIDSDTNDFDIEESDFALTYAVGTGFTLYIADGFTFLTKVNLTSSTALTYFVPGEDRGGFPFDNFNAETSSLNYIQLQFGMSYVF